MSKFVQLVKITLPESGFLESILMCQFPALRPMCEMPDKKKVPCTFLLPALHNLHSAAVEKKCTFMPMLGLKPKVNPAKIQQFLQLSVLTV
jgi:hypothetical protein